MTIDVNEVKKAVEAAATRSNRVMQRKLRRTASKSGWDTEAVMGLSVDVANGESAVDMTNSAAEDAEFGTLLVGPNPVARDFESEISAVFQKYLRKELRKRGVRI